MILLLVRSFYKSIYYLSEVEIGSNSVTLRIHKYDKLNSTIEIEYKDLDIDLLLNILSRYNTYRLEIRRRNNNEKFTFDLVHKQYEIGYWKRSKLKDLFSQIRQRQSKLSSVDEIK